VALLETGANGYADRKAKTHVTGLLWGLVFLFLRHDLNRLFWGVGVPIVMCVFDLSAYIIAQMADLRIGHQGDFCIGQVYNLFVGQMPNSILSLPKG